MDEPRELELDEDMTYQRRAWAVERIGLVLLLLCLLFAALGGFGQGVLSGVVLGDAARGGELRYDRFIRFQAATKIVLRIADPRWDQAVWLAYDEPSSMRVEGVIPQPTSSDLQDGHLLMRFRPSRPEGLFEVVIDLVPEAPGLRHVQVGVGDKVFWSFWQLVYP